MKPVIVDPTQPNEFITRFTKYIISGDLLDLGAGPGRHAAFAAQNGFNVVAVEPDEELCIGLRKIPDVEVIQSDIASYSPNKDFDVIICAMVLHFLNKQEVDQAIKLMQETTKPGGINVISAYTDQNPSDFMTDNPYGDHGYLLKINELKASYEGWEILEYKEVWTAPGIVDEGDTPQSFHKVNMIAQRV